VPTDETNVQKAVAKLIKAGFQISPDTLDILQKDQNPNQLVDTFLSTNRIHPSDTPVLKPAHFHTTRIEQPETTEEKDTTTKEPTTQLTSKRQPAENVKSEIKILKDPTPKLQGKGTIDDFLSNFQDRYYRLRDIISQRRDGKGIIDIQEAMKAKKNTANDKNQTVKIVGQVTKKTTTKSGNIAIGLDDLTGRVTVIVQKRDPNLISKTQMILLDQVLCVEGTTISSEMLLAKDLFLPDIPSNRRNNRAKEDISALLISDIHYGSQHFLDKIFQRVLDWLQGKEGSKEHIELAGTVKYVVINGDLIDGIGIYPNQLEELNIRDLDSQFNGLNRLLQEIPNHIHVIIAPGNHDGVRLALPRPAIDERFLALLKDSRTEMTSLGCPSQVSLHGVNVLIYHGDSLVDIMAALSKPELEARFVAMREMLRGRHLAPIYGKKKDDRIGTTLAPEPRDWLVIDDVPDILHCGHVHVTSVGSYRKTLLINSGTFQSQTNYQKLIGIEPTPGIIPLVNLHTLNVKTLNFTQS
jgi:DNA polymerase II small subunit